jgi:hypothetical protein
MEPNELELIEMEETVSFALNGQKKLEATGTDEAITRARERIGSRLDEVVLLLRQRQGLPEVDEESVVKREIAVGVPSLAVQRANYITWFSARSKIYQPSEAELDCMFAAVFEGDEVVFDFAQSFTIRRRNGLLLQIDRKGRTGPPSPYSPAVRGK